MNTRFEDFLSETQWENYRVLDLCTGSGCIGITLALMHPKLKVDCLDISAEALEVANSNIQKYALQDRVQSIQSDLFTQTHAKYDLIISNPPYVSRSEYKATPAEFKSEPKLALESGKDGLDILHRIIAEAKPHLNPNGRLIVEVGVSGATRLKKKYPKINFKWYKYKRPGGQKTIWDWFAMDCIFECKARDLV